MDIPQHAPVLVAVGARTQRAAPADALEAAALATGATMDALTAAGVRGSVVDWVGMPDGMTTYRDPARIVAEAIGAPAHTVLAQVGVQQNTLIAAACTAVQSGAANWAVVCGAEAHRRTVTGQASGVAVPVTVQGPLVEPDQVLRSPGLWQLDDELDAGLVAPGYYALMESALRAALGEGLRANRVRLGAQYARLSETAASNPRAVRPTVMTADSIANTSVDNPMIAFPYTRAMVSSWTVDISGSLLITTVGHARSAGIDPSRWVYPLASVEANTSIPMTARADLTHSSIMPMLRGVATAVTGLDPADVELVDLYSCFPFAVEIAATGLGRDPEADRTVGGGMAFAGGPLNNAVLQATVRMAERVLDGDGRTGLVSCVSGDFTKQGFTLWSADPPRSPYCTVDLTAAVNARERRHPVVRRVAPTATVRGCTVLHQDGLPQRAVAVLENPDGTRVTAWTDDRGVMASMMETEWVGRVTAPDQGWRVGALADKEST